MPKAVLQGEKVLIPKLTEKQTSIKPLFHKMLMLSVENKTTNGVVFGCIGSWMVRGIRKFSLQFVKQLAVFRARGWKKPLKTFSLQSSVWKPVARFLVFPHQEDKVSLGRAVSF